MKIVNACVTEIPDIVRLNSFVQRIHHDKFPDVFKPVNDDIATNKFFEYILKKENNVLLVAYDADRPVGYAWVELESKPEFPLKYGREQAYIHQIAVHEDFRKQHVGTSLFNEIKKLAKNKGIDHFELDSWAFNTDAHKFFERLGFETYNVKMWRKPRNAT